MKKVVIKECPPYILAEREEAPLNLSPKVYGDRLGALLDRMDERALDFVIIYGDREHFANIEYFTKYDCRFEEALLIVTNKGEAFILTGNEGEAYSAIIPYDISRIRYDEFSLQGQPRVNAPRLRDVFGEIGIDRDSKVGLAGFKYFESKTDEGLPVFDVPAYIVYELYKAADRCSVYDFTAELTGMPNGIRLMIRSSEEIAYIDYQATRVSNVARRLLKNMEPGISELELSRRGQIDFSPVQMFPVISFGEKSVSMGLKSPDPLIRLQSNDIMAFCYSLRGSLLCRTGFAAHGEKSLSTKQQGAVEGLFKPYWSAVAAWYETMKIGCTGGELFSAVDAFIGEPKFGLTLNPGHFIGMDEWVNSPVYRNSPLEIRNGAHIQCDIIASSRDPFATAICEDTVIAADGSMREALKHDYPLVFEKIRRRQDFMRKVLKIQISEDLLPMSELNAVMFPYMLNSSLMLSFE
jgi:hypothetical protein